MQYKVCNCGEFCRRGLFPHGIFGFVGATPRSGSLQWEGSQLRAEPREAQLSVVTRQFDNLHVALYHQCLSIFFSALKLNDMILLFFCLFCFDIHCLSRTCFNFVILHQRVRGHNHGIFHVENQDVLCKTEGNTEATFRRS